MKQGILLLSLGLLIGLVSGCAVLDRQSANRRVATQGLDNALSELPTAPEFTTIQVIKFEFPKDDFLRESFIARGYVVLGFSIPEEDAVNRYFQAVQKLGWQPRPDQYESTKVLRRGNHEVMVIGVPYEPSEIKGAIAWAELQKSFESVVIVSIDYRMPGSD